MIDQRPEVVQTVTLRWRWVADCPAASVWRAISDPAGISAWTRGPAEVNLVLGGCYRFALPPDADEMLAAVVCEVERGEVLAVSSGTTVVRWEVTDLGLGRSLLSCAHHGLGTNEAADVLLAWWEALGQLDTHLSTLGTGRW